MILKDLHYVLGGGEPIRIATEHGRGWLVDTTTIRLDEWDQFNDFIGRTVVNIYTSEGREKLFYPNAKPLCPAICIIVEGFENGTI